MSAATMSCLSLAVGVLLVPSATARGRLGGVVGGSARHPAGALRARMSRWRGNSSGRAVDPLRLAAGWELLAAGVRAGMPIPIAVRAVADELTGAPALICQEVAGLLSLGSDPAVAWEPALRHIDTAELARAARRTARAGNGLAEIAAEHAHTARKSAEQHSTMRARRAEVWVAAPLGLCFLPAFLFLGVAPVVLGMVRTLDMGW